MRVQVILLDLRWFRSPLKITDRRAGAAHEPGPSRVGALYAAANFGVVDIDWWEHKVALALRDEGGNTRRSVTLSFDELGLAK